MYIINLFGKGTPCPTNTQLWFLPLSLFEDIGWSKYLFWLKKINADSGWKSYWLNLARVHAMAQFRIEKSWHKKREPSVVRLRKQRSKNQCLRKQWWNKHKTTSKTSQIKKSLMSLPWTRGTSRHFCYTMLCYADFPFAQADNVYQTKAFVLHPNAVPPPLGPFASLY